MNIYEQLLNEREQLDQIIHEASKFLSRVPKGHLRIQKVKQNYSYYKMGKDVPRFGLYLSKERDYEVIKSLAVKRYCNEILKVALEQQEVIDKFLAVYQENSINDVLGRMNPGIIEYITPFEIEGKNCCKCTSEATTETVERSPEVDLARNLLSICSAFLKAKGY